MKGKWLVNLVRQILKGHLSPVDGWHYLHARLATKPTQLRIANVLFQNVDHILWSIIGEVYINREYTPDAYDIRADDVVVDIGAHKGVFTAYAATRTRAPILAFEPSPANLLELEALVANHDWKHVSVKPFALAGRATPSLPLYKAGSSSRNSIRNQDPVSGQRLLESSLVPAISLDEALSEVVRVDLLKLDCEGAEYEILAQASPKSLAKIRKISLEYHPPPKDYTLEQLKEILASQFDEVQAQAKPQSDLGYLYARKY